MERKRLSKWKTLMIALVLFVLVVVTAIYVCYRLGVFSGVDEKPYIPLVPTPSTPVTEQQDDATQGASSEEDSQTDATQAATQAATEDTAIPSLIVYDDQQVWSTKTEIELFSMEYENGEEKVTVLSDNKENLIAPGTENSYTFRLKNTGNVSMNYSVTMRAYISDNVTSIPVEVRMRDFNGNYCIGDEDSYAPVSELDGLQDYNTLAAGYYAYYTLEWHWPYEWGDDAYDTYLGNLAADEPVTLTIEIQTLSAMCDDPNHLGGLLPATGDDFHPVVWIFVSVAALCGIILLIILRRRRKEEP